MARDDIPIKVTLDYPTIKLLEKQAQHDGVNRGAHMRKLLRAALGLQRLLPQAAVLDALAGLHASEDPKSEQMIRRLLQAELGGN